MLSSKKEIVVALSRFPYPLDKGDKLRAYYQILDLSKEFTVHLFCISHESVTHEQEAALSPYCASIQVFYVSKKQVALQLLCSVFSFTPFQVDYFYNPTFQKALTLFLAKHPITLLYVQTIRMVKNLPLQTRIPLYLDYMDAFSLNFQKRIAASKQWEKPFVFWEYKKLARYEKNVLPRFAHASMITRADLKCFTTEEQSRFTVIPNGIAQSYFEYNEPEKHPQYDLIFTGNMGYHPNVQACKYLVERILPQLQQKGYKVKLCLAGISPTEEVQKMASEQVVVTGFVPDMRSYLSQSQLFVAPLFSGAGLQNKLLEAMAMGIPVITSPLANAALQAIPDQSIMVCANEKEFANTIVTLLQNKQQAQELARQAKAYVKTNFDWFQVNQKLIQDFNTLL